MQLRVRDGKGAKGRVLPLSERLLQELVSYWRAQRQGKAGHNSPWLFLGKKSGSTDEYIRRNILSKCEQKGAGFYLTEQVVTRWAFTANYPIGVWRKAGTTHNI
jgi:integrase